MRNFRAVSRYLEVRRWEPGEAMGEDMRFKAAWPPRARPTFAFLLHGLP